MSKKILSLIFIVFLSGCYSGKNIKGNINMINSQSSICVTKEVFNKKIKSIEDKINSLQNQVDALNGEKLIKKLAVDPISVQNIANKIKKELDPTNSYVYQNTMLPKYNIVKVYYGTGQGNYNNSFLLPKSQKEKGIIVFKNLKDNTKYYYEIYGDGSLISKSYFKTSKK